MFIKNLATGGCLPLPWGYINVDDFYFQISSSSVNAWPIKAYFILSLLWKGGGGAGGQNSYK